MRRKAFRNTSAAVVLASASLLITSPASAVSLNTLATFDQATTGSGPIGNLLMDGSGNLFGTAQKGIAPDQEPGGHGTVFEYNTNSHLLTALATFNTTNGAVPEAGVTLDSSGNLWGTTFNSGSPALLGSIFEYNRTTNSLSTPALFGGSPGTGPDSSLIADSAGNFYGTASFGGANSVGTIFQYNPTSNSLSALASFTAGSTGAEPQAGLVSDSSGNFYGTTYGGGANSDGTIFKYTASTGTLSALASFNGIGTTLHPGNGTHPMDALISDSDGNLFGTTSHGGINNDGTIFEYSPSTNKLTVLAAFNGTNGANPQAGLIEDAAGNLFGTTYNGGTNTVGAIFEYNAAAQSLTAIASFNGGNGINPDGGLIADAFGNLYGTTLGDETSNFGTIFELTDSGFVVAPEPAPLSLLGILLIAGLNRASRSHRP